MTTIRRLLASDPTLLECLLGQSPTLWVMVFNGFLSFITRLKRTLIDGSAVKLVDTLWSVTPARMYLPVNELELENN